MPDTNMLAYIMKKITFILILISSFANAQSIKELYVEEFKGDWKIYENENYVKQFIDTTIVYRLENEKSPEQMLIDNAKENLNDRADRILQIVSSLKINFSELDSLAFIEHRSTNLNPPFNFVKKGAIIANDSIYGFSYDLENEEVGIEKYDYFQNSENETINQAKQIIGNLILSAKTNYLDTIAKVESDMFAGPLKDLRPETKFDILIYNKKNDKKLRRIYLHETFVQIMNQK